MCDKYHKDFVYLNRAYFYNYVWDKEEKISIGFMAQDLVKNGYETLVTSVKDENSKEYISDDGFVSPGGISYRVYYYKALPILYENIKLLYKDILNIDYNINTIQNNMNTDSKEVNDNLQALIDELEIDKSGALQKANFSGDDIYQTIPIMSKMIKTLHDRINDLQGEIKSIKNKD